MLLATIAVLALTRAELVARMKAPVLTMSEGLVQVYADCPEDMRRDYQMPAARFAADVVEVLYRGAGIRPRRFAAPWIMLHLGSARTNLAEVVSTVQTNGERVVTRIYVKAPGHVDRSRLCLEIAKAFNRAVCGKELDDAGAAAALRAANPRARVDDSRNELEEWLRGEGGHDDEEALALMRKVIDPGRASRRDVLVFASRLCLYSPTLDRPFAGGRNSVTFRDAVAVARIDPRVRFVALEKANELPVLGGGRGETLAKAAEAYSSFLRELARGTKSETELLSMLDDAEARLTRAWDMADRNF